MSFTDNIDIRTNVVFICGLLIVFLVNPFCAFVLSLLLINTAKRDDNAFKLVCIFFISLFWALLAFTQKSLYYDGTDCTRYYSYVEHFEEIKLYDVLSYFDLTALINYIFYPVSAIATSLTGNVQVMSFIWVFVVYLLSYLSVMKLLKHYGYYNTRNVSILIVAMTFCFMLFVQISELLKQSSSFAVMLYGFTIYITKGKTISPLLLSIIAVGLHPSSVALLPLYLYKCFKTKYFIYGSIILLPLALTADIYGLIFRILPGGNYMELIIDKYGNAGDDRSATLHYVAILLIMFYGTFMSWAKSNRKNSELINIACIYALITSVNYSNLTAFLRLTLFSHYIFGLLLVSYLRERTIYLDKSVKVILILMFVLTLRFSYGRTLNGSYRSSYMNNSLSEIVFSSAFDYLAVDYEK